jgi:hypothetical protein
MMGPNDQKEGRAPAGGGTPEAHDTYAPRKLTFAENVKLTIKVLAGAGLMVALLWALSRTAEQ